MKNNIFKNSVLFLAELLEVFKTRTYGNFFIYLLSCFIWVLPLSIALFDSLGTPAYLRVACGGFVLIFFICSWTLKLLIHKYMTVNHFPVDENYLFSILDIPDESPRKLEGGDVVWEKGDLYHIFCKTVGDKFQDAISSPTSLTGVVVVDRFALHHKQTKLLMKTVAKYTQEDLFEVSDLFFLIKRDKICRRFDINSYLLSKLQKQRRVNEIHLAPLVQKFCLNEIDKESFESELKDWLAIENEFSNLSLGDFEVRVEKMDEATPDEEKKKVQVY